MSDQGSLFGGTDAYGGTIVPKAAPSRATDPETSHEAGRKYAESGKLRGNMLIVYSILKRVGQPMTHREVWHAATSAERESIREENIILKRLNDLRSKGVVRNGEVRICKISDSMVQTWEA